MCVVSLGQVQRRSMRCLGVVVMFILAGALDAFGQVATGTSSPGLASAGGVVEPSMLRSTLKMLGGLCLCIGALGIGVRLMRRFGGPGKSTRRRRIEVRERTALSGKTTLFLIAIDNREYLVANGANSISVTPTHSVTTPLFAESLDDVYREAGDLHA